MSKFLKRMSYGYIVVDQARQLSCDKRGQAAFKTMEQNLSVEQQRNLRRHGVCKI